MREAPEGWGWVRVRRRTPRLSRGKVRADRPGASGGGGAPPAAWVKLIIRCCDRRKRGLLVPHGDSRNTFAALGASETIRGDSQGPR